jgi:L-lysine 2,3-aminomutase
MEESETCNVSVQVRVSTRKWYLSGGEKGEGEFNVELPRAVLNVVDFTNLLRPIINQAINDFYEAVAKEKAAEMAEALSAGKEVKDDPIPF